MSEKAASPQFDTAELTAIAHLYRGERYHSTVWRTRLDTTTNWALVMTGAFLSATAGRAEVPAWSALILGGLLAVFLTMEARRYRYHDIWRTRVRVMEKCLFVPLLRRTPAPDGWRDVLADDYDKLRFHISAWEALGRRLRRNYAALFALQAVGYLEKLVSAKTPATSWIGRAAIGPIPGVVVLALVVIFYLGLIAVALLTLHDARAVDRIESHAPPAHDAMLALATAPLRPS